MAAAAGGGVELCVGRVLLRVVFGRDRLGVVFAPADVFRAVPDGVGVPPALTVAPVFRVATK